jgi:hypothetical protein
MDSSVSETYGRQEGSAYNGYFGCECYHPLFCFNQFGDLELAMLRNGNVHSAEDWPLVLEPILERYRGLDIRRFFRGEAAFADPKVYQCLEVERYLYAIRLPANAVPHREIEPLLARPAGRPSNQPVVWYHDFSYQAGPAGNSLVETPKPSSIRNIAGGGRQRAVIWEMSAKRSKGAVPRGPILE